MISTNVKEKLSGDNFTAKPMDIPVFMPKDILEFLFGELGMEIPMEAIRKYWSHANEFQCPWSNLSPEWNHIPISLYGDAAKYAPSGEKIIAVFMSVVLWVPRSARMTRFLLFTLENDHCLGPETLNPLFAPIVESLILCYREGIQVKGSTYRFATSELRGDWEWHVQWLDMKRSWRMHEFCWRCNVSKKPGENNHYLDLRDEPEWVASELSHVQFLSKIIKPRTASCLFLLGKCFLLIFVFFEQHHIPVYHFIFPSSALQKTTQQCGFKLRPLATFAKFPLPVFASLQPPQSEPGCCCNCQWRLFVT